MRTGTPSYFNAWTDTRRCLSGTYMIRQVGGRVNLNKLKLVRVLWLRSLNSLREVPWQSGT